MGAIETAVSRRTRRVVGINFFSSAALFLIWGPALITAGFTSLFFGRGGGGGGAISSCVTPIRCEFFVKVTVMTTTAYY